MRKIILFVTVTWSVICSAGNSTPGGASYTTAAYRVSVQEDILYGEATGYWTSYPDTGGDFQTIYAGKADELMRGREECRLTMDLYTPKGDSSASRPLLVFAHGGAFFIGDKAIDPIVKWCRYFASLGYVVSSVNYRLGFRPTPNAIVEASYCAYQDMWAAIRFLVYKKEVYRIDPSRVFVAGNSAGAITALNVAYMRDWDWPKDLSGRDVVNYWMHDPYRVLAVANLWGAVRDLSVLSNANVPVISFHARWDPVVPFDYGYPFRELSFLKNILFNRMYGSESIHEELKQLGRSTKLYVYDVDLHELFYDEEYHTSPRVDEMMQYTAAFFSERMRDCNN